MSLSGGVYVFERTVDLPRGRIVEAMVRLREVVRDFDGAMWQDYQADLE